MEKKESLHGGARPGSGRKQIGTTKKVAQTLPAEDWAHIDRLIAEGRVRSYSQYFRDLHQSSLSELLYK